MSDENVRKAFMCMEQRGGGFAQKLALAWFAADRSNQARIELVFRDLIEHYADIAKMLEGENG